MFVNLSPSKPKLSGLGCAGACGCGGTCGGKGMGHGVQEYVPNSWQQMFAGYSLGGMLPPPGMGSLTDPTTWGMGTWAMIGGGALLLMMGVKSGRRRRRAARSERLMRRVRGY